MFVFLSQEKPNGGVSMFFLTYHFVYIKIKVDRSMLYDWLCGKERGKIFVGSSHVKVFLFIFFTY